MLSKTDEVSTFWKQKLSNVTELILPTDFPRPIPLKIVESQVSVDLEEKTSMAILKLSMAMNSDGSQTANPFTILMAAFSILISKYTGEEDITLGSSSCQFNPLVLRLNISSQDSFLDVVGRVMQTEKEAALMEIPFTKLLSLIGANSSEKPSLFKVRFFNLTDTNSDTLSSTSMSSASSHDLTIFISQSCTTRRLLPIQIKLVYNSVLFSHQRMVDMLDQLSFVLESASSQPDVSISELSLVTCNSSKIIPNPTQDLHWDEFEGPITSLFERNAELYPQRTCVVESKQDGSSRTFTYQQINSASNLLAHYLIENGIQREDIVVLYSYRGVDLVVAVMGVLKAGATFSVIGKF